ncbi:MAG: acyloxyacyl hydrolase [Burkholderiaceae bacterium]|nr:acyloxyacyl hydrolase [Burkholderiaceae bacterium]
MDSLKRVLGAAAVGLALFAVQGVSHAGGWTPDGASFEVGMAKDDLYIGRVALQWDWDKKWFQSNGTHLNGYWDLNLGWWHLQDYERKGDSKEVGVIGLTPVFRFEKDNKKGPYIEAGIGISFFSKVYNNSGERMGTSFEFADHIGVGYVFDNKFDLGLRIQHYSNAGISDHNGGENLILIRGAYRW